MAGVQVHSVRTGQRAAGRVVPDLLPGREGKGRGRGREKAGDVREEV
jgi:hypothetical protein